MRPRTQAITLEIIMRTVFGIEDAERLEQLRERLGRVLDIGMQTRALASIVLPPAAEDDRARACGSASCACGPDDDEVLYDEIARRRTAADTAERDDVLSILLQARDEHGQPDDGRRAARRADHVAGRRPRDDRNHARLGVRPAAAQPGELERLQAEVDAGEGSEYLDAVIKETLRIRPVVPGVVRKLTAPLELNGYQLPAGVRVAPNIYLTHRRAGRLSGAGAVQPRALPRRARPTPTRGSRSGAASGAASARASRSTS